MASKIYVRELETGDIIQSTFLVSGVTLRATRDGEDYLALKLQDRSGEVEARAWREVEMLRSRVSTDDFVAIRAEVAEFADTTYLNLQDLQVVDDSSVDLEAFFPRSRWDASSLLRQLKSLIDETIQSPQIQVFLETVLDAPEIANALENAPAAKKNHHAFHAGLVEHVLSMARLSHVISGHYEAYYPGLVNRDLVIAGCVLHDLGKCVELDFSRHTRYSTAGQLVGHIAIGANWVDLFADRASIEIPEDLRLQLKHLILSHHGHLEYGSPVTPRTVEAMVLHHVDMIDSRMNMCWNLQHDTLADADDDAPEYWSAFSRSLDGAMHFRGQSDWEVMSAFEQNDLVGPGSAKPNAVSTPIKPGGRKGPKDDFNLDLFSSKK